MNHIVLYEGPSNLYRGFEGVGGNLVLTEDCLVFIPHNLNIQKNQEEVFLKDIISVEKAKSLGILPNAILIKTNSSNFKFVVKGRNEWVQMILGALNDL